MGVPSRKECLALLKSEGVPENIVAHSLVVERVAVFLARELKRKGVKVDAALVSRGALLHDVDKHATFDSHEHGFKAFALLEEKGWHEIALIARRHLLQAVVTSDAPATWEEKIVFYADKRVTRDEIVSLEERFAYLRKRYGHIPGALERINESEPFVQKIERQIFDKIGLKPADLSKKIR